MVTSIVVLNFKRLFLQFKEKTWKLTIKYQITIANFKTFLNLDLLTINKKSIMMIFCKKMKKGHMYKERKVWRNNPNKI